MDAAQADAILARVHGPALAQLKSSNAGFGTAVRVVTIDLSTAKQAGAPYELGFPFTSMTVVTATDSAANFNMRVDTSASFNDAFNVKAPATVEFPLPVKAAYLDWSAQAGKTITLAFLLFGSFKTNQTSQVLSGGVTNNDGSTSTLTQFTLTAATANAIYATADYTRKKAEFRNNNGESIWLGPDNTVTDDLGANRGREVGPGDDYTWYNNGPLYAYSKSGGTLSVLAHF